MRRGHRSLSFGELGSERRRLDGLLSALLLLPTDCQFDCLMLHTGRPGLRACPARIIALHAMFGLGSNRGMHYSDARDYVWKLCTGEPVDVDFVSPIVSVSLAALAISRREAVQKVQFRGQAAEYARHTGLTPWIFQSEAPLSSQRHGGKVGDTYTPLASLVVHSEVEHCNGVINGMLRRQLTEYRSLARDIGKVVGELHDNVASHANGRGFCTAQVYGGNRVELAIADAGCGLRTHAARALLAKDIDDPKAIVWAFQKGTTSAKSESWDQKWSPGRDETDNRAAPGDNHQGLGLWELRSLVTKMKGRLWVATGNAQAYQGPDGEFIQLSSETKPRFEWSGLLIEVEIPIGRTNMYSGTADELAEELGL